MKSPNEFKNKVIIMGASVGGPNAILNILSELQSQFTSVIIIQHIFKEIVELWVSNFKNIFPI
ncbi:MAG: chemotaxis protein CheB [Candidatus Hodarchaeales archaeon]